MTISRRELGSYLGLTVAFASFDVLQDAQASGSSKRPMVGTNSFPWMTFADRNDREVDQFEDSFLSTVASTGIQGYEPILGSIDDLEGVGARLQKHGLVMNSAYVEADIFEPSRVDVGIESALSLAKVARSLGARIMVTNPSPISWDDPRDKNDQQLRTQANALNRLGLEFKKLGLTLAYHNHDLELRQGAREFHHMLTATDPNLVKLCLDSHWVFRGCGGSEVAVFDALSHYYPRIVELHLRQSTNNVWNEAFGMQGDIDYLHLFKFLRERGIEPYLVLEQSIEDDSPANLTAKQAHRLGREHLLEYL